MSLTRCYSCASGVEFKSCGWCGGWLCPACCGHETEHNTVAERLTAVEENDGTVSRFSTLDEADRYADFIRNAGRHPLFIYRSDLIGPVLCREVAAVVAGGPRD
jgi:hypothetical protein